MDYIICEPQDLRKLTSSSCRIIVTLKKRTIGQGVSIRVRNVHAKKEVEVSSFQLVEHLRNELGPTPARTRPETATIVMSQDIGTIKMLLWLSFQSTDSSVTYQVVALQSHWSKIKWKRRQIQIIQEKAKQAVTQKLENIRTQSAIIAVELDTLHINNLVRADFDSSHIGSSQLTE